MDALTFDSMKPLVSAKNAKFPAPESDIYSDRIMIHNDSLILVDICETTLSVGSITGKKNLQYIFTVCYKAFIDFGLQF